MNIKKNLSFSFVSRFSHVWCRSKRFDCILLVIHKSHRKVALSEIKLESAWLAADRQNKLLWCETARKSVIHGQTSQFVQFFFLLCFCSIHRLNHLNQFRLLMDLVHMSQLNQLNHFLSFVPFDCFCRLLFFSLTTQPLKLFKLVMFLIRWNPSPKFFYHLSYLRIEPLKLDCTVCAVELIKILMLFI